MGRLFDLLLFNDGMKSERVRIALWDRVVGVLSALPEPPLDMADSVAVGHRIYPPYGHYPPGFLHEVVWCLHREYGDAGMAAFAVWMAEGYGELTFLETDDRLRYANILESIGITSYEDRLPNPLVEGDFDSECELRSTETPLQESRYGVETVRDGVPLPPQDVLHGSEELLLPEHRNDPRYTK